MDFTWFTMWGVLIDHFSVNILTNYPAIFAGEVSLCDKASIRTKKRNFFFDFSDFDYFRNMIIFVIQLRFLITQDASHPTKQLLVARTQLLLARTHISRLANLQHPSDEPRNRWRYTNRPTDSFMMWIHTFHNAASYLIPISKRSTHPHIWPPYLKGHRTTPKSYTSRR